MEGRFLYYDVACFVIMISNFILHACKLSKMTSIQNVFYLK